jgi:hypothetical protein
MPRARAHKDQGLISVGTLEKQKWGVPLGTKNLFAPMQFEGTPMAGIPIHENHDFVHTGTIVFVGFYKNPEIFWGGFLF